MRVSLKDHAFIVGGRLEIALRRTLRVPDDGRQYPLPPGLGRLPVAPNPRQRGRAAAARVSFIVPMYQREAIWIGFSADWPPFAIQVGSGRVNTISGRPFGHGLHDHPQDYVVCPEQLWIDGVNAGDGHVRQFVAMPLGAGYSVEGSVTGREAHGGIQFAVYRPKRGAALKRPVRPKVVPGRAAGPRMGLGAGGRIAQKLYPDPHGIDAWDQKDAAAIDIAILNSEQYLALTGIAPPPTPVDARTYTEYGLPWFELYDEHKGNIPAAETLKGVTTIAERDRETGEHPPDQPVDIDDNQIRRIPRRTNG